jgi:ligand-binding sensor domain-containing protein
VIHPFKYYFFLSALALSLSVKAQYPFSKTIPVEEENLSIKINVLFKDHYGFLWVGTSEGLFKIYGHSPVKIKTTGNEKLHITAIGEDASGKIWTGCKNGSIAFIKNRQLVLFKPEEGVPKVTITSILTDSLKRVWFATGGEGIYYYDNIHLNYIDTKDGLGDDYVNCLYSNDGKNVIAGTDRGLSFIQLTGKKKNISIFTFKNGLPDNIVRCISTSLIANHVWVGTQSKGFYLFDLLQKQLDNNTKTGKQKWEYGQVNDLKEQQNEIIIATQENGMVSYNKLKNKFSTQVLKDSASLRRVEDIEVDNEDNTWLASENNLISYTGQYLHFWYKNRNVDYLKVHTLLVDDEGSLWLTPDLRLYRCAVDKMGKESLDVFDITPAKDHIDITSLYKDKFGFMWIGTMGEGLFRLNPKNGKWRRIAENPTSYFGNVLSIAGNKEEVWVSSLNGVSRFYLSDYNADLSAKILFDNYTKKDGLGSDYVYSILIDSKKRIWFATDGAGLTVFVNGKFKNFNESKEFNSKVAYSVAEDETNNIWISTYNDGVFKYDGKKFTQYGLANGLTDLAITSMAIDDSNRVVLVNKKGIDMLDQVSNTARHYGPESGFKEIQPNLNSISKDAYGNIWIGTENGIVQFTPNAVPAIYTPVTVLEDILLFNQNLPPDFGNRFKYNQNNLTFLFSAVNYSAPEKVKFQYWLEAYSDKWETTNDRSVIFPGLLPGKYTMRIRASTNENFNSSPITAYPFIISKPFWAVWWFRLLAFLFTGGLVYWLVKSRLKRIRKKDLLEKERFQLQYDALKNQVNPHFLFNSFNALLNVVEENPKEAPALIKHLSQFYRKMTAYREKDVILLEEELELLSSYLFIQHKRYGNALRVNIDVPADIQQITYIPPLVLQLLAENAVKHNTISYDRPLHLSIYIKDEMLVIENNINRKFDKEEGEGLGLQNIESRYRLFAKKEVRYGEKENRFIVQLPIIKSI